MKPGIHPCRLCPRVRSGGCKRAGIGAPIGPSVAADMSARIFSILVFRAAPGSHPSLNHRDLTRLDLSGLDFKQADLSQSNLFGADLSARTFRDGFIRHDTGPRHSRRREARRRSPRQREPVAPVIVLDARPTSGRGTEPQGRFDARRAVFGNLRGLESFRCRPHRFPLRTHEHHGLHRAHLAHRLSSANLAGAIR